MKGMTGMLTEPCPVLNDKDAASVAVVAQWTEKDNIVRGCILSALSNVLFDVYCSATHTVRSLWDTLDTKYNTDDVGVEKYCVDKFLKYHMVEGKSVTYQVHEFQIILQALEDSSMELPEMFVVMSIIEKFPRSWEDFDMFLKHRTGNLSVNELMTVVSSRKCTTLTM
jgi:hypothetical protein